MGTLIRMKAEVKNPELPVITEQGILPYYEGVFVNRLAEQGFTLSAGQKTAIEAFFTSIGGLTEVVRYYWPFIGNSSNVKAAKVPLIGSKLFDYSDGMTGFKYNGSNDIIGLTFGPTVISLNTMDFCSDDCCVMAASFVKDSAIVSISGPQNLINCGNALQFRSNSTPVSGSIRPAIFSKAYNATYPANIFQMGVAPDNYNDAGNTYILLGISSDKKYCRYAKTNDGTALRQSEPLASMATYGPVATADRTKTLSPIDSTGYVSGLSGLVVFSRILTNAEMDTFMGAMKTLNIALGKEITV